MKSKRNTIKWEVFNRASIQTIGFLSSVFLARLIAPSEFGVIALLMIINGFLVIFSNAGLTATIIQTKSLHKEKIDTIFTINLLISSIFSVMTFLFASEISNILSIQNYASVVKLFSIVIFFNSISATFLSIIRRNLDNKLAFKANSISALISSIIGVTLAIYDFGILALVFQQVIYTILSFILYLKHSKYKPVIFFSYSELRSVAKFSSIMFLNDCIYYVSEKFEYLIINRVHDLTTIAFYQRAKQLNEMLMQYTADSFSTVTFQSVSKLHHEQGDAKGFFLGQLNTCIFTAALVGGALSLLSTEFILLSFGEKWRESIPLLQIFALTCLPLSINATVNSFLKAMGDLKYVTKFTLLSLFTKIASFTPLIFMPIKDVLTIYLGVLFLLSGTNILFLIRKYDFSLSEFKAVCFFAILILLLPLTIQELSAHLGIGTLLLFILKGCSYVTIFISICLIFNNKTALLLVSFTKRYIGIKIKYIRHSKKTG